MAAKLFHITSVAIICVATNHLALAEESPLIKLNATAQQAFDQGKFKKAQTAWTRTIHALEDNGQNDSFLESCLKRLGQTYRRLECHVDAYQSLNRAHEMCVALQLQDDELNRELSELAMTYRNIDPAALGEGTARALHKANVTRVSLTRTDVVNKMQVDLPERFEKPLEDKTVDGLAFDKKVTLDLDEAEDGTVSLKNIKGMRIHATEVNMWVNLMQAVIKPEDAQGQYPAEVTAGKMGVTKTVSAILPHKGFEPLSGLLKELKAMSAPGVDASNALPAPSLDAQSASGIENMEEGRSAGMPQMSKP